jgi:putative membrane protein
MIGETVMSLEALTRLSTACIVLSGCCLLLGWYFIRWRREIVRHRNSMLTAAGFATLFLVFYVTRWSLHGSKPFPGDGGWRLFYFANLIPHILFAAALAPLVIRLIYLALGKRDYPAHRRLARVTLPIWLYVAASGWLIYYLLYGKTY